MSESIARFYDPTKNESGGRLPGVPLRDLTQDEYDALPEWQRASVDALPFYRKTKPTAPPIKAEKE